MPDCYWRILDILLKTYLANWVVGDTWYAIEFQAESYKDAENHCNANDLDLLGEKYDEQECPPEVEAMIHKHMFEVTEH